MSIKWYKCGTNHGDQPEFIKETHVGLVLPADLKKPTIAVWAKEVRIMSDVWADEYYCRVWEPITSTIEIIRLNTNFENDANHTRVEVDCDPQILDLLKAQEEAAKEKKRLADEFLAQQRREAEEKARMEARRRELLTPKTKGEQVIVVKNKKLPPGSIGRVEAISTKKESCLVTFPSGRQEWFNNPEVERVLPGLLPGDEPGQGWSRFCVEVLDAVAAWRNTLPKKGDRVVLLADSQKYIVTWVSPGTEGRLGVRPVGSNSSVNPIWVGMSEYSFPGLQPFVEPAAEAPVSDTRMRDGRVPPEEARYRRTISPAHRKLLPLPCQGATQAFMGLGLWNLYDKKGTFLLSLTPEGWEDLCLKGKPAK